MDLLTYLRAFRRRWTVVVAAVAVALVAGWFTTEAVAPDAPQGPPSFSATTLLVSGGATVGNVPINLETLAIIATLPETAEIAAEEIGYEGDPLDLRSKVQASPDSDTGVLTITTFAPRAARAEELGNAFATALSGSLQDEQAATFAPEISGLRRQIEKAGGGAVAAELRGLLAVLEEQAKAPVPIRVIQEPLAEPLGGGGLRPPQSRATRLAIAGVIGLLAGLALVLVLERVDTRIRSGEQAQDRYGMPVLAEIPVLSRAERRGIVTFDRPTTTAADAFRLLGAGVGVAARDPDGNGDGGRVVLVTSAGPAEGKTTVVSNLAAALAEEGSSVIVVSADLRRPALHRVFETKREPGLDAAARSHDDQLFHYQQETRIDRVKLVASGPRTDRPAEVLGAPNVRAVIRRAKDRAGWVLIDTAPILIAGESAPLIAESDLVVVVARAGKTSDAVAHRGTETLQRLGAERTRLVLNGTRETTVPLYYRRYQHDTARASKAERKNQHPKPQKAARAKRSRKGPGDNPPTTSLGFD